MEEKLEIQRSSIRKVFKQAPRGAKGGLNPKRRKAVAPQSLHFSKNECFILE